MTKEKWWPEVGSFWEDRRRSHNVGQKKVLGNAKRRGKVHLSCGQHNSTGLSSYMRIENFRAYMRRVESLPTQATKEKS